MKKNSLIVISIAIIIIIAIFVIGGKKNNTTPETKTISGTVTYLEKMTLPENSIITVELHATSPTNDQENPLSLQIIAAGDNQVPIPFSLTYNPKDIQPDTDYALLARISVEDQILWNTPVGIPVITKNHPTEAIEIIVAKHTPKMYPTTKPVRFEKTPFSLVSVNGSFITGPYTATFSEGKVSAQFCNGVGGEYTLNNGIITAPTLISTMMFCENPQGLMEAEQTFSKILSEGAKITITGSVLELMSGDQKMVFQAK